MAVNRMTEGFKLYQKGCVSVIDSSDEEIQFEVISNGTPYMVVMRADGSVRCMECEDWSYRFGGVVSEMASFLCKHCYASLFKLASIKGVNQQTELPIDKKPVEMIDHLGREWIKVEGKLVIKEEVKTDEPSH
jgi:hypothetical protein